MRNSGLLRCVIWLGVLATHGAGFAYTLWPEYQSLSEDEITGFADPSLVSAEYDSDYFTLLPEVGGSRNFLASVGSLGAKNFLVRESIFLDFPLGEVLSFRTLHFRNNDFEDHTAATIYEFRYRKPETMWAFALYGEADYLKRRDDIGLALLFFSPNNWEHRLYFALIDFSRNERNGLSDRFASTPYTWGFLREKIDPNDFHKLVLHFEGEMKWLRPSEDRIYNFSRVSLTFLRRFKRAGGMTSASIYYDKKSEGEMPDDALSSVALLNWNQRRLLLSYNHEDDWGIWGFSGSYRHWQKNSENLAYWAAGPLVGLNIKRWSNDRLKWRAEYSFLSNNSSGEIAGVTLVSPRTEHRLNLRAIWRPSEKVELGILFSFDADRLAESDRWEGGAMNLSANF